MRIGVLLPTFTADARRVFAAARAAELAGIDGIFCYDHLWQPETSARPSLAPFPLLGALAAQTERVALGTLVARIALTRDEILVDSFATLDRLSGGRVIAGLGTGDWKSAPEHTAFGLPYPSVTVRRATLARCADLLVALGVETWIGGGGDATNAVAVDRHLPLNLWSATPARVAEVATSTTVTWGGVLPRPSEAAAHLVALRRAGAAWAVFTWGRGLAPLLAAVERARAT
jgi:alkanesulfonate monooxygenase SsuD/methylene tetrahydromethanopterin reductase-like flavin-dependent oxidoreductase (luciferase family)